jgi:hypothetical protein
MTGEEILAIAKRHGVEVTLFGDEVRIAGEPTEELRALFKDRKQALIAALKRVEEIELKRRRALDDRVDLFMRKRGLARTKAEREAEIETYRIAVVEYLNETFAPTPPDICAHCNGLETAIDPLLPFGEDPNHAWVHRNCSEQWRRARRAAAVAALAQMGINQPVEDAVEPRRPELAKSIGKRFCDGMKLETMGHVSEAHVSEGKALAACKTAEIERRGMAAHVLQKPESAWKP